MSVNSSNIYAQLSTSPEKYEFIEKRHKSVELRYKWCIPKRYAVTLLVLIGIFLWSYLRSSLSIVVTYLSSNKTTIIGNETVTIDPEFAWTSVDIGYILSAYYLGCMFSVFIGPLIHRIGGVTILGLGLLIPGIITTISPLFIRMHLSLFIIGRVIIGWCEGCAIISVVDVFTHWAPAYQRAAMVNIATLGAHIGITATYPLSGFIIQHYSWKSLFHVSGGATIIWSCIWLYFVSNNPTTDKFISKTEKTYLANENASLANDNVLIPWKSIFRSVPVYALLNEYFITSFTISFFITCIPLYIKDVYKASIQDIGLISGLPEACEVITLPIAALLADYLRTNVYSIGKVHRLYILWGQVFTLIMFFISAVWGNLTGCIICICLSKVSFSFADCSYNIICIDMGGPYSGLLKSMAMCARATAYFLNPVVTGYMVPNHSQSEWNCYFFFISFITMYGVIMFLVFGSGDLQPWARLNTKSNYNKSETQTQDENLNEVFANSKLVFSYAT